MRFKFKVKGMSSYFYTAECDSFWSVLKIAFASSQYQVNDAFWEVLT